jgi:hypothetical protein
MMLHFSEIGLSIKLRGRCANCLGRTLRKLRTIYDQLERGDSDETFDDILPEENEPQHRN